jgi:hypothetical protein
MPSGKIKQFDSDRGGFLVFLDSHPKQPFITTSSVIQSALFTAFLSDADVTLEVFEKTFVIQRVAPFDVDKKADENQITRLATQLNLGRGVNLLEIFVIQGGQEVSFQASDSVIQQVCCCAALAKAKVKLDQTAGEITRATFPFTGPA